MDEIVSLTNLENVVLNSISELIVYQDFSHRVIFANRAAANSVGKNQEDLVGEYCYKIWHKRDSACDRCPVERSVETGKVEIGTIITPDGRSWLIKAVPLRNMVGKMVGIVEITRNITTEKDLERRLQVNEEIYREIFNRSRIGFMICDTRGSVQKINQNAVALLRKKEVELLGKNVFEELFNYKKEAAKQMLFDLLNKSYHVKRIEIRNNGNTIFYIEVKLFYVNNGHSPHILVLLEDVTEKQNLEKQFYQAQKMESIGRLASGVAHDFNNVLTVIMGYADMMLFEENIKRENLVNYIDEIKKTIERATELTRQLLIFSRTQVLQPKIVDVNIVIKSALNMIKRILTERIKLKTNLSSDRLMIEIDITQFTQVLLNLTVNAKDAMPDGGDFTISTEKVGLKERYDTPFASIKPGDYVKIAVADTGTGMDSEILGKIFDPFFTTKEEGRGTGLGLSTVQGIVKQSNGYITVETERGKGSVFHLYFPEALKV